MAIWEEEGFVTLIGFVLVVAVGINIMLAFGGIANFMGPAPVTGFAGANCVNTFDGIKCGSVLYPLKEQSGVCQSGTTGMCTNSCQIEKAISNDNRDCPESCAVICVPDALAARL